ncbi:MAG TPA: iron-containing alcohol dehydrogenase [Prolixibacteraceae bacterium]|nr:iron-containing alcohol dehydrogenase [Prolixibacteraceae bacterium]HPS12027.1 iron-containing alcohol dehydrogenase [Prolixibacteraceae bacterium]
MNNFIFYNHTKILFGKGQIATIADEIPEDAKVLMIFGSGSIKANGIYDQVVDALGNIEFYEFPGIEPNPSYEKCMKALDVIEENDIDYLLAVGGGSVVDAAKFIAAASCYQGVDPWDILAHNEEVVEALPIGVVLTLPATGTEMNGNSVISRLEFKEKLSFSSSEVLPQFSVLDPEVVATLPARQIGNGVVDAFVHVIEQYLTYPVNATLQDRMAESILLTLIEEGPKVLKDPANYDACANFMWSATMALNGLIRCGVPEDWTSHMIGHEITALCGVDHARTLAIVLPGVMNVMRESKKAKIILYGQRVWGISEADENKAIDQAIQKTIQFFESMGLPTHLKDYKIPITTIDEIVERMEERGDVNIGENKLIGITEIRKILKDRF